MGYNSCQNCNNNPNHVSYHRGIANGGYYIFCDRCGMSGPVCETGDEAKHKWDIMNKALAAYKVPSNPIPKGMRIVYLKDQIPGGRVLTVLYTVKLDEGFIYYNYTINRTVHPDTVKLDERLRFFMNNKQFNNLQKEFKKRFGSDQHSKKQARLVVMGKYNRHAIPLLLREGVHPLITILTDLFSVVENGNIRRIANYNLEFFYDKDR